MRRRFLSSLRSYCDTSSSILVGNLDDFVEGTPKELDLGKGRKVLFTRRGSQVFATGTKCSHYNFALEKGVTCKNDQLLCPLHNAAFSIETGLPLRGPVRDGIPTYKTTISSNGEVYIRGLPEDGKNMQVFTRPAMARRDPSNKTTFIIVGGGPCGLAAAEGMRSEGFTGRILMISQDAHLPYDRVSLSKKLLSPVPSVVEATVADVLLLRKKEFYDEFDIEVILNTTVSNIDFNNHNMICTSSTKPSTVLSYDKVLLCTGSRPRNPQIPGAHMRNVFYLRSIEDALEISRFVSGDDVKKKNGKKKIVIVGGGFISIELASALKDVAEVTIIGGPSSSVPLEKVLGKRVGSYFARRLENNNIRFRGNVSVKLLRNKEGLKLGNSHSVVAAVELDDGDILQADGVILATGSIPNTEFILKSLNAESHLSMATDGSILVDPLLRARPPTDSPPPSSVYCAGDIASFPFMFSSSVSSVRIEHWVAAVDQGRIAGRNMAGAHLPYTEMPFFWTRAFDKSLQYVGNIEVGIGEVVEVGGSYINRFWDKVIVEGDLEKDQFVAYYCRNDKIEAVATVGMLNLAVACEELLKKGLMPDPSEFVLGKVNSKNIHEIFNEHFKVKE